jgi:hypothetical protein
MTSTSWHDNAVHALAFQPAPPYPGRPLIDLDYISEWVQPAPPAKAFTFWLCPLRLSSITPGTSAARSNSNGAASTCPSPASTAPRPTNAATDHGRCSATNSDCVSAPPATPNTSEGRPYNTAGQRLSLDQRGGLSFDESSYTP